MGITIPISRATPRELSQPLRSVDERQRAS